MMVAKKSLWDIGEELLALEEMLNEMDGDISDPAAESAITQWLSELANDQAVKADGYVNLIRKWEMEAAAAKAEEEQYAKRRKVREARVERFKAKLKKHMEDTHQKSILTVTGRNIVIQNNGGVQPMEIDMSVDPKRVDPRFQYQPPVQLDSEAIRNALATGEKLEFASLKPRGTQLRIR